MTDRLEEIKQTWRFDATNDMKWLISEVERLRAGEAQEEPGEWKVEINRRGYGVYCLPAERKITFGEGPVYCETALSKALATYLSARLNHMQGTVMECDVNNALSSLDDALRQFNAGEGAS